MNNLQKQTLAEVLSLAKQIYELGQNDVGIKGRAACITDKINAVLSMDSIAEAKK